MKGWLFTSVALVGLASTAAAQQQPTTVQLPELHQTSVNTTVSVPDRGSVLLGGSSSGMTGRVSSGLGQRPFGNSATNGTSGGGGMFVGAQIHDMQAMDEAILGQTANRSSPPLVLAPEFLNQSGGSVADLKARAEAEDAARERQAVDELAQCAAVVGGRQVGCGQDIFSDGGQACFRGCEAAGAGGVGSSEAAENFCDRFWSSDRPVKPGAMGLAVFSRRVFLGE